MTTEQFKEFVEEVIPQQLFHVSPTDIDDETGGRLEEVILVGLIANSPACLKYKPLQWFIDTFLNKNDLVENFTNLSDLSDEDKQEFGRRFHEELEQQFLNGDMISTDDLFPSSEEELFRQIQEDERNE